MAIKSRINDVPFVSFAALIDIVFLLLIFFVLQPFKEPENALAVDRDVQGCVLPWVAPKPIVVMVDPVERAPDAAIFRVGPEARIVHEGAAARGQIAKRLTDLCGGDLYTPVLIDPRDDVHFEHVMTVIDACCQANLPVVHFVDEASAWRRKNVPPKGGKTGR